MSSIVFSHWLGSLTATVWVTILNSIYTFYYTYLYSKVRIDKTVTLKNSIIKYILASLLYPIFFIGHYLGIATLLKNAKIDYNDDLLVVGVALSMALIYFTVIQFMVFKRDFSVKKTILFITPVLVAVLVQIAAVCAENYIDPFLPNYEDCLTTICNAQFYSCGLLNLCQAAVMFISAIVNKKNSLKVVPQQ